MFFPVPAHRVTQWSPFVDPDENRTWAMGTCDSCKELVIMTCSCGETFYVRGMTLVCRICDWLTDGES